MAFGFRRGFIYTFTHTLGWFGAMIAAFFFSPWLRGILTEKTALYERIFSVFYDKLSFSTDTLNSSTDSLPLILGRGVDTAAAEAARLLADKLADLTLTILCFLMILLAVKFLAFLLTMTLSKRKSKGFVGFVDGLLGLVAGLIKGTIFVFLFLALLLPAANLISPASTQVILNCLDASYFSRILYDSNFIILIANDFLI